MNLKISDMVLIPQGVYLHSGDENTGQSITITAQPNYGIIISEKLNTNSFKDLLPVAIGDKKFFVSEQDVFPCL